MSLDMIVSEVTIKKYQKEETLIIEIELEDERIIHSIMDVKILPGGLPLLHLFCDLSDIVDYQDFDRVTEHDSRFPNIEEGITIEAIRKVEMPLEEISLKLKLPIDQVEWLKKQKKKDLNVLFKEMLYDIWKAKNL